MKKEKNKIRPFGSEISVEIFVWKWEMDFDNTFLVIIKSNNNDDDFWLTESLTNGAGQSLIVLCD